MILSYTICPVCQFSTVNFNCVQLEGKLINSLQNLKLKAIKQILDIKYCYDIVLHSILPKNYAFLA